MGSVTLAQVCGSSLCSPVQCGVESRFSDGISLDIAEHKAMDMATESIEGSGKEFKEWLV